jgi:hypothetical protein
VKTRWWKSNVVLGYAIGLTLVQWPLFVWGPQEFVFSAMATALLAGVIIKIRMAKWLATLFKD